jgi:hypothetical protein
MKQKALPSYKFTWAAWPKAPNWSEAWSSASKIVEELLFSQLFFGKAPFGLVMGVDEVLHGRSPG